MRLRNFPAPSAQYFRGSCTSAEAIGKVIYVTGNPTQGIYPVRTADSGDEDKVPGVGVVIRKYSETDCLIQRFGEIHNVFSGLEVNKTYKLNADGDLQRFIPAVGPGGYSFVQFIGTAIAEDVLWLSIEQSMKKRIT